MAEPVDFYFDFSSPYGYIASQRVDDVVARHGRAVRWRPYLMGVVMQQTGAKPLTHRPLIGDYATRDFVRTARFHDVPFAIPEPFPIGTVAPCRAFYWLDATDPAAARALGGALYRAYFAEGRNISEAAVVAAVAAEAGVDADALAAGVQEQAVKDRLRAVTEAAAAGGVFGSPFFVVDGEPFWGNDRLDHVERWLETGGW